MNLINKMQKENKTICEFCGKEKEGIGFFIGATNIPGWCMIAGSGKIACPECYKKEIGRCMKSEEQKE